MSKTFMIATEEWEGLCVHGFVVGTDDTDIDGLWCSFREEFAVAGSARFHSPLLEQSPYPGDPEAAFIAWLLDKHGFERSIVHLCCLTFGELGQHHAAAHDPELIDVLHAGSAYQAAKHAIDASTVLAQEVGVYD